MSPELAALLHFYDRSKPDGQNLPKLGPAAPGQDPVFPGKFGVHILDA